MATVCLPDSWAHDSPWPISCSISTPPSSAAHGTWFCFLAVSYSACQVNGLPEQSDMFVSVNPFAALACMNPLWPVVRSAILVVKPPGGSLIDSLITSPGFILSVLALPSIVLVLGSCGAGEPGGMPLVCR